jgi:tetratricopeptide (TPR) repeat protein|nr:MAG: hypothetical protein KatS3mg041_0433 [Bacteroidota bacterium]
MYVRFALIALVLLGGVFPIAVLAQSAADKSKLAYNEGLTLVRQQKYQEALAKFDESIQLDPQNYRSLYMKGLTLARLNRVQEAIEAYRRTAELAQRAKDARVEYLAHEQIGKIYTQQGKFDEALAAYDRALAIAPAANRAELLLAKGTVLIQQQNYEKAIPLLEEAVQSLKAADKGDAYWYLARAYNASGAFPKALEAAQKAVELIPGGPAQKAKAYFEMGQAYRGLGRYNEARDAFQKAAVGPYRQAALYELELLKNMN